MLEKLQAVENRYEELCFRSEQPDFYADPKRAAAFLRETLGAACGGRREMIQGTAKAAEETLKEAFKRLVSPELCGGALTE